MIEIKLAEIKDIGVIVELLNEVTLQLHEKGINQWVYPCNSLEIEMGIREAQIYVLIVDDIIVGTFSLKPIDNLATLLIEANSSYLFRVAILPEYQGKSLGVELVNYACEHSRKLKNTLYLDCWAGNKKLRKFYSNAGFDFLGDFPEEDYFISVFRYK